MALALELLANLFDSVIGAYFVLRMNKGSLKESKAFWLVSALCFAVSTAFLFISDFSFLHSILITVILLCYAFSIKTKTAFTAILSVAIYELTLALSSVVLVVLLSSLFGIDMTAIGSGLSFARFLLLFISKIITTAILVPIIKYYTPDRYFKPIDLVLYLVSPVITIITLGTFLTLGLNENITGYYPIFTICSLGLVAINALSLILFIKQTKNENEKHEMQIMLQMREAEIKRHNDSQKHYESVRILRHDIKEQILYVKQLIENGELKAAEEHIEKVEKIVQDTNDIVRTGNKIIDSILYYKIAMNPDIRFIITGTLGNLNCIGNVELVSLLTNMLDNAIEATEQQNEKIIEVTFSLIGGFQNISCKNPIAYSAIKTNPEFKTTKNDKHLHGYGIKSMKKAVETANGLIEFYEEDNYFICHAALPVYD